MVVYKTSVVVGYTRILHRRLKQEPRAFCLTYVDLIGTNKDRSFRLASVGKAGLRLVSRGISIVLEYWLGKVRNSFGLPVPFSVRIGGR